MWSGVTFSQADFVGFALSTNNLVKRVYIGVQNLANFETHYNKQNK